MQAASSTRSRQTALITGASFGIGREFAKFFAADRYDIVLVARTEDKLDEVKRDLESAYGIEAHVVVADLADPTAPEAIWRAVSEKGIRVDTLVNNAGFGGFGLFHESDLEHELRMIQVNIAAVVALSKFFVREMVARGSGQIVNVASTAAYQPGPLQSVYYATKAFVLSFTEAMTNELHGTGVRAMAFCPGPTLTEFHARAGTERSFKQIRQQSAVDATREGYQGMKKGKGVVIAGLQNRVLAFGTRFAPRSFSAKIARKLQDAD
ncbi:MAG: SDR family oxidoreductase [Candidatus Krumholzibacteriota bacterium]|nr:SDR family oxidoreductase [Candidatus Krumholzibacteriota bacterium]